MNRHDEWTQSMGKVDKYHQWTRWVETRDKDNRLKKEMDMLNTKTYT